MAVREKPQTVNVAPPRGERGLKSFVFVTDVARYRGRSPSWGAWIEIPPPLLTAYRAHRRSPSWGAWIEITLTSSTTDSARVAPPRGERGLKSNFMIGRDNAHLSLPLVGSVD